MNILYIAHPIKGDVKNNILAIYNIVSTINNRSIDILAFAPYLSYGLDDNIPSEREKGIIYDKVFFDKGIIDGLWLFGNRVSDGMIHEIDLSLKHGIHILCGTKETLDWCISNGIKAIYRTINCLSPLRLYSY